MRRCWKRLMKSHKGFTLVELICTIAIFSIVITGVGTAMVVSARSYQRGNAELDLQQQAQITSNLLTNLIIDSDRVVQADGNTLIVEKVESGVTIVYQVYLDGSNIMYTTSANTEPHILAENVQDFSVRQDVGGNVDFALKITDAGNTRNYESDYHVTPRNGITSGGSAMSGTASLFVENKIILEPGQTYDLNVRVMGTSVRGFGIEGLSGNTDAAGTSVTVLDDSTARITVGLGETSDTFHFQVKSDDAAVAPQNVGVMVRRVKAIYVNGFKIDGTVNKTGANYKVTAPLDGPNLDREPGAWYDVDYVNPYAVDWSFAFTKEDDNGHITMPNAMDYIEVTGQGMDGKVPYVTFRLKQNMTQGCALKVTATAVHPEGQYPVGSSVMTNKSGEKYGTVSGSWELEYQAWRRNGKLDITVPLTERDFWIYDNGTSLYKHTASVSFVGYNSLGIKTEEQTFNPWTGSQNALLNIEIPPMSHIEQVWNLILNVSTDSGDANGFYNLQAYSSPYHAAVTVDQWEENGKLPSQTYGYFQRYHVASAYNWRDTSKYDVKITYQHTLEDGTVETTVVEESYPIEEVTILYRNSSQAAWVRDNIIYVTPQDTMTDYTVYFMFDRGWDDSEKYYFHDLRRFVGLIHDDPDYTKDVRRDIPISSSVPSTPGGYAGEPYLTFVMDQEEKQKCYDLAKPYGGIIQEIYEYNPYLCRLNMDPITWEIQDEAGWADPANFRPKANPYADYGVTQQQVDQMKGCKGKLLFCFKDPNITVAGGVTPKIMYCPTITEYGPVYYIDNVTRFVIGANAAEYQTMEGGSWVTRSYLTRNPGNTGWIAN